MKVPASIDSRVVRTAGSWLLLAGLCLVAACSRGDDPQAPPPEAASVDAKAHGDTSEATAVVFGEAVTSRQAAEVQQEILEALFAQYREEHGLEVTDREVGLFVEALERGESEDEALDAYDELTPDERQQADEMRSDMARALIVQWKTNRALYQQYGGRVIGQQFGPEPLDAYRRFLEEQQAAGNFAINDPDVETSFWQYFRDESIHDFLDADAAAVAFDTPPWEQVAP